MYNAGLEKVRSLALSIEYMVTGTGILKGINLESKRWTSMSRHQRQL